MNTRLPLLSSLAIAVALAAVSCAPPKGPGLGGGVQGSKVIQTDTRHPGAFETIIVEYPADVTVQQGASDVVWIEADDNLIPQISTEVTSGRLTIKTSEPEWNRRVNPSEEVKIAITVKNPTEIVLAAPVGTLAVNDLKAGTLKLVLSGGGQITATGLDLGLLDTVLSGAGDVQVGGTAAEQKVLLSGWGKFDAAGLTSNKATINHSGAGEVIVRVEKELVATVSGAGSVKYFGNPRIDQTVSGAGSIKPAE